jgi:23S rRNA pseudouridine1911/1915/1917 synthase
MVVLYEDNHTIAAVKPAGIPVMADSSGDESMLDMVKEYIKVKYSKPGNVFIGLVHRLDRETGGAMVFARTSKGASRISAEIRQREFKKTYLAVIEGEIPKKKGALSNYLKKNRKLNKSFVVDSNQKGAKEARLEYEVLESKNGMSLVSINMETGRHHQIRVQFSNAGHPLAGDVKYGGRPGFTTALWSYSIEFKKPVGDEMVRVVSEPDYCKEPWSLFS